MIDIADLSIVELVNWDDATYVAVVEEYSGQVYVVPCVMVHDPLAGAYFPQPLHPDHPVSREFDYETYGEPLPYDVQAAYSEAERYF